MKYPTIIYPNYSSLHLQNTSRLASPQGPPGVTCAQGNLRRWAWTPFRTACIYYALLVSKTHLSFTLLSFTHPPIFSYFVVDDKCCYPLQVAHDVDGSGNYLLLTHRHVSHLHPFSSYLCRQPCPNPPSWVLYHEFTISCDNCIRIASEVHPQMWVKPWDYKCASCC